MIFSSSEILTYKRCGRKNYLGSSNRLRLSPRTRGLALDLGTAVHSGLAAWRADPTCDPRVAYVKKSLELVKEAEEAYRQAVGVGAAEPEYDRLHDGLALGQKMLENYVAYWRTPLEDGYSLVSNEQHFLIPIPGTPHFFKGYLDAVLLGPHDLIHILDVKTYERRKDERAIRTDEQFMAYIWTGTQLYGWDRIAGLAYDGLWKRAEPPSGKTMDDLFCRVGVKPSREQIVDFEKMLKIYATEMADQPDDVMAQRYYRNDSCVWPNAGCHFEKLCLAMSRDEDTELLIDQFFTQRPIDADRLPQEGGDNE